MVRDCWNGTLPCTQLCIGTLDEDTAPCVQLVHAYRDWSCFLTLTLALAWLEYCNSSGDTYNANLRRANGRDEPYKVKYWALGNEIRGLW
jgi:alpha-L-arabinofuranosidase